MYGENGMRKFDYEKLYLLSLGESNTLLKFFRQSNVTGNHYIKNERIVVANPHRLSDRTLAEYLGLCSLRTYPEVDLPVERLPPWVPMSIVQENPLIKLSNDKRTIMFIYEGN